ncbi:DUF4389 domain-containing protein [Geodermatophilus sp. SYSU D01036]
MSEHVSPVAAPPPPAYPVRVDGALDPRLSRGLWLVKWLLLVPHVVVLAFLWTAVAVVTVVAFFAVLVTARYPRPLFDFTVGVLRWTWRVQHYGYSALGTDRYPPFTLADVPGYPARLDVAYPERLSRGLVLVKWLLALPHYLVLAVFVGGGLWFGTGDWDGDGVWSEGWAAGGLVALLVLVAGVVLLFTGRYPQPLYDFVLGMDRWALRVSGYVLLLTDAYPPFRFDMGGPDPAALPAPAAAAPPVPAGQPAPAVVTAAPVAAPATSRWTAGPVAAVVAGALLVTAATGLLAAGGSLLWADTTQRAGGFVTSEAAGVDTAGHAAVSQGLLLQGDGTDWVVDELLGTARVEATATGPDDELFLGLARTADVDRYLGGVARAEVEPAEGGWWSGDEWAWAVDEEAGGPPRVAPEEAGIWTASAVGTGTVTLDWRPDEGDWTVVLMRADGGAGIEADVRVGATLPGLTWVSVSLLAVGALLLAGGVLLVALGANRARPLPPSGPVPAAGPPVLPRPRGVEPEPSPSPNPQP